MAETIHGALRALHITMGFLGLAMFWILAFAPKGRRTHITAGKVFSLCAYTVALTALGSSLWVFIHPSSWTGQSVTLSQIPANQIMFIAILGLLSIFLLQGVENGMRDARCPHAASAGDVCRNPTPFPQSGTAVGECRRVSLRRLPRRRGERPHVLDPGCPWSGWSCRFRRTPKVLSQPPSHTDGLVVQAHGRHGGFGHRLSHGLP